MPYVAKGKCVYKRDTGKKVGCTKGSVKKYLAALHANVNESEILDKSETFLNDKVLVFNPPIKKDDYLEKLAPILMSMNILWFDGQPIKRGGEIGKNIFHSYKNGFKYFLFDKKNPKKDYYTQRDWVMSAIPDDKTIEKYQEEDNSTFHDFNNSEKIDGWGFINNFKEVIDFNPFDQLNESRYPGIVRKPKVGDRVVVNGWYGEEGDELGVLNFNNETGTIIEVDIAPGLDFRSGGEVIVAFDGWRMPDSFESGWDDSIYHGDCHGGKCMQFSNLLDDDYDFSIKPLSKNMDVKGFDPFEQLNESEDLEWAQDVVNRRPLEFQGKEILIDIKDLSQEEREELVDILSSYMDDSSYRNGEDGIFWDNSCIRDKSYLKPEYLSISLHCGIEDQDEPFKAVKGLVCCLYHSYEQDDNKENIIPIDGRVLLGYNLNESEENDLGWAQEIIDSTDLTDLKGKAWEIILPGPEEDFIEAQKWAFNRGFKWFTDEGILDSSEYSYSALCSIGSIFHDNIKNSTLTYGGSGKCNRETILEETTRIAKNNARTDELYVFDWDSNKKEAILTEIVSLKPITESEEDDLAWAEDTVNADPTYRFNNLVFKPHHIPGAVRARLNFPNGHYISVVGGPHLYGDGVNTFEIWGSDADEPEGYLTKIDVTNRMLDLQALPPLEGKGTFSKEPITESEEWFEDVVSNPINLIGTAVYFDNGLSISEWRKFKELMRRDEIKPLSVIDLDDMDSVMEVRDKHLLFMIDENRTVAFHNLDLIKKRMAQGQEYSSDPLWGTDLSFNSVREYFNVGIYRLINGYDLTGGSITESEDDFEWAKDVIDNTDRWVKFNDIQKGDYVIYKKGEAIVEPGAGGFWLVGDLTKCLAYNPMDWSTVSVPCYKLQSVKEDKGQRYFSGENIEVKNPPEELGHYSALFKIIDKTDWLRERGWRVPLKGNWHLRADHINPEIKINESDDFEWAQEVISGLDQYEEYKGEELRPGTVLMITGEYEDLYFKDQWAKIVRKQGNDSYLLTFSKYIENGDSHTHCGEPEEYESDEYHCGCTDSDSQVGRCWFTSLNSMDEVKVFPNLRGFLGENKKDKPLLTEGRYDAITRKAVKDIMQVITNTQGQNDDLHQAELPNSIRGDEYEYMQDGMAFSIELNVHHQFLYHDRSASKESEAYFVNTAIAEGDDNVIMMTVVVDPNWEPRIYEKLFYKLQEDIRHEIEHLTQSGYYRIEDRPVSTTSTAKLKTVFGHHKHKLEVPALVHGFYRRAKLEKRPIDDVMMEDLDSEIEKGNLSKKQAESLLKVWVDYAKKNLPTAIYSQQ